MIHGGERQKFNQNCDIEQTQGGVVETPHYRSENRAMLVMDGDLEDPPELIEEYLKKVICPVETNIEIYITQSWLNYTTVNQNHHAHYHANSFLSGVFYFKGDKEIDRISFQRPSQPGLLQVLSKKPNVYNIVDCNLEVDKALLLILPSTVVHYVEQKKDDNERISLSFNTYVKGNIGDPATLTQLKL